MLTGSRIRGLKPTDKRVQYIDDDGLYIEVSPAGRKVWRYRCFRAGRRTWVTLGDFPEISLREARTLRDEARKLSARVASKQTFSEVAEEWLTKKASTWAPSTHGKITSRLTSHVYPILGDKLIGAISSRDVLDFVHRMEAAGISDLTHRMYQVCSQIFRYAVARQYCTYDPTPALRGALLPLSTKHHASLTDPAEVGDLMRRIDAYPQLVARCAMRFSALTFCRPGEIRHAEWEEIKGGEWRIPAAKMKMKRPHIVPLSRQAVEVIEALRPITGHGQYVFPSSRAPKGDRPMSDATVLVALRSLGYDNTQMTAHGFRSMASTLLNENGFNRDWIERQLAHVEGNSVRAAYNYAEYLPERRKMMQWWADYLDGLRARP